MAPIPNPTKKRSMISSTKPEEAAKRSAAKKASGAPTSTGRRRPTTQLRPSPARDTPQNTPTSPTCEEIVVRKMNEAYGNGIIDALVLKNKMCTFTCKFISALSNKLPAGPMGPLAFKVFHKFVLSYSYFSSHKTEPFVHCIHRRE